MMTVKTAETHPAESNMTDLHRGDDRMERAKELFFQYHGNRFHMDRDGAGSEYDSFHVSRETEEQWTGELISRLLESKPEGREALRLCSAVSDMIARDSRGGEWDACLYYPMKAGHLDDVTVLFLLSCSFRMAEKAVKKHLFSAEEAAAYRHELDCFCRSVLERADGGTLTRSEDYVMREFSDPVYVKEYIDELKTKWDGLFR